MDASTVDIDGDALSYSAIGLPADLNIAADTGLITGTIDRSASQRGIVSDGVYKVGVTADDLNGGTTNYEFLWTVPNPSPVATNNSYSTLKGGAVSGNVITDDTGAGVDSDPDGDPLAVVSHSVSGHGLLSLSDDGSFSYTHDGTEALADSFSYTISDGNGGTAVAVVSITVLEDSGGGTAPPNSGDRTKPVVTIHTPQEGAVYEIGQVVNADYECSDEAGGSGMATCVGEVAVGSAIDTGTVGRAYTFSVTGTDVAGNFSVATHSYTVEDNGSGGGTARPNSGDRTKPVVIIHTPQEGAVYEIGQVVNADYECSDEAGGSGMATCVGEVAVGSAIDTGTVGRAYTFSVTGTDVAGNFSVATHSYTVEDNGSGGGTASPNSGDRTKPVVIIHTPKEGAVYQVGQVVNADYECSDEAGGSGMATCLGDVVVGNAIDTGTVGRAYTFSVTGTDVAGNFSVATHSYTVEDNGSGGGTAPPNSGDTTKPVVIIHTPQEGAVYKIGQVVNADYECSDEAGGSGMATCLGDVVAGNAIDTGTVGRAYTFSVTGTDVAGNFSVATHSYTVEDNGSGGGTAPPNSGDTTKPVVIIHTPKEGAVYEIGQVVNADYECSDEAGGSGMATCVGEVAVGSAIDTGTVGRAYTFSVTGTDVAGNFSVATHSYTVEDNGSGRGTAPPNSGDRTKPVVTIHTPKEGAVYEIGQVVNADYECSDEAGGSGMATCVGEVAVGSAIDTGTVGRAYTFSVTGTDVAGNQTTLIHHFTVVVQPPGSNGGGGSIPGGGSGGSGTTSGGGSGTTSGGWWLWDYQWWRLWDYQWWWLWDYQWRRLWDYQWRWLWDYQWRWLWDYQWWRLWDYQWWWLWDYQWWWLWDYQWWRLWDYQRWRLGTTSGGGNDGGRPVSTPVPPVEGTTPTPVPAPAEPAAPVATPTPEPVDATGSGGQGGQGQGGEGVPDSANSLGQILA